MVLLSYILLGLITGIFSGLLGLGGGVIIVPALVAMFTWQGMTQNIMHLAIGTSLAVMVWTTLMTAWSHNKRGAVNWLLLRWLLPGTILGAAIGVTIARSLSSQGLRHAFAVFTLLLGLKMILGANGQEKKERSLNRVWLFLLALVAGILSGILGLGGGVILIPLLLWLGQPMVRASATSAACSFPTALTGALGAVITGWHMAGLPSMSWGYVYWPVAVMLGIASLFGAPIGVRLAHRLPVPTIKRIFGAMLFMVAWQMFRG